MATPLLSVAALFVSAAVAAPPVDSQRVTGNVSTQHHPAQIGDAVLPRIDTCRVTGNILTMSNKGGGTTETCAAGGQTLPLSAVQSVGGVCSVDGTLALVGGVERCAVETEWGPLHLTLPAIPEPTVSEESS